MIHKRNFKFMKFTPYGSMVRYEAKVLEKNKDQNTGAVQSFRKESRIRKRPELIFPKMTFLIEKPRCGGFARFSLPLKSKVIFS